MTDLTITQDTQKRYLKSVLSNLAEYGFNYRSVYHTEGVHGLTIDRAITVAFETGAVHISVTHTGNRGRKIGLLLNIEEGVPPAELISDVGAAHKSDIEIAERCIARGTAA